MKKNRFISKFENKSNSDLNEIISNKKKYTEEALEAAEQLLKYRKTVKTTVKEKTENIQNTETKFIPEKDEYEFRYSFIHKLIILLTILFFIYLGYSGLKNGNNNSFLFILFAIVIIALNYKLIKNRPEIVISRNGIWTNKLGKKQWNEIDSIVVENKNFIKYFSKYINDNLFIYLIGDQKTSPSETIDLRGISNKKTLRQLCKYYLENKDTLKYEKNTFVHGSTIYDTENQLESYKKSYPKIILIVIISSFVFPIIDKFWDNGFVLIEKYGYTKSVVISLLGFSSIYFISYLRMYYKSKK
ncbi:hypothetical protein [Ochrovirga pacifica]|uniref:hypothetical protein n=1 Tax=Ochrovirga pacifica TaxID=1042376 RepID=UPI0002559DE5|nr:hypothetical protein [Ochrovirga pacifica]